MDTQERKSVVFLSDGDLVLRPPQEEDLPLFMIWMNDPEVRVFLKNFWPVSMLKEREWLERISKSEKDVTLVIVVDGKPIGVMGIHKINFKDRNATTGAVIGDKGCWGKQYGRRAKQLLLEYAFHELGLNKINSSVIAFNERSLRYSLACGYKEEGRVREQFFRRGRFWDQVLLGITRADWEAFRQG